MARPCGARKAQNVRPRRAENIASLTSEVLRLRLQALTLPVNGNKATLVQRLKAALQQPHAGNPPRPDRGVKKCTLRRRADVPAAQAEPANNGVNAIINDLNDVNVEAYDDVDAMAQRMALMTSANLSPIHSSLSLSPPSNWQLFRLW
ncbi:hypothetical protein OS493_012405 [Desmophyllum pertusum]|uniref:SAP domain-containing protein n=1 Tax=Desmophyllum pertusum TaxID=174260 RepID=A0A9W9ZQI9_9CNID|nr:hypothetical protein OS493_012405 [Desmophyllum pertusum]